MGKLDGSELVLTVDAVMARKNLALDPGSPAFRPPLHGPGRGWRELNDILNSGRFSPRTAALEADETRLQVVTYGVLCRSGTFWAYRREPSGTEGRLHGRMSVGVGGHVNPSDSAPPPGVPGQGEWPASFMVRLAIARELAEEVGADPHQFTLRFEGYLFDDGDAVGRVHLGLVYLVDVPAGWDPTPAPEIGVVGWRTPAELEALARDTPTESWTAALVGRLDAWAKAAALLP